MTHGDCSALLSSLHSPDVISSFKDLTMTIRLPGLLKKLLLRRNITLARQVLPISISTEHPRLYIYRCLCVCDIYQINLSVYHSLTVTKRGNISVSMLAAITRPSHHPTSCEPTPDTDLAPLVAQPLMTCH